MPEPLATIVVVPREQFGRARASLDSIRGATEATEPPYKLIYVDGNSPPALARHLAAEAKRRRLTLIRRNCYLTGNEARNLALQYVETKYVVFADNDVLLWPGCLSALIGCAEETNAWIVGPLYCVGDPDSQTVHTAGAELRIVEDGGQRRLYERHHHCDRLAAEVRTELTRERCDEVEFHCLLMRTDVFERLGAFDNALLSYFDHTDLFLAVQQAGGTVCMDSAAVVTYLPPPPLAWSDIPYFTLRWSETWFNKSLNHFCRKWTLDPGDPAFAAHVHYRRQQRRRVLTRFGRLNALADKTVGPLLEKTLVRRLESDRRAWLNVPAAHNE